MHIHVHMHMHMCLCMWVYHVNSRNATEYLRVCCPVSVIINLSRQAQNSPAAPSLYYMPLARPYAR